MTEQIVYDSTVRPDYTGEVHSKLDLETGKTHQWYPDRKCHTFEKGNKHWTNQDEEKGSPGRHKSPNKDRE